MHPELFSIGFLHIRSWGLMLAVSFLLVSGLVGRAVRKNKVMSEDDVLEAGLVAMFSGLLGARIAYVIEYWHYFQGRPLEIIMVQRGGMVFYGGLLLGMTAMWFWLRAKKLSALPVLDTIAPPGLLGFAIGRIGCFLNACCYGRVTTHPWGMHFPDIPGYVHPTQLYEAMAYASSALVFYFVSPYLKREGQTFGLGLIFYSVLRFGIEFLRVNPLYFGLSSAQWISIPLLVGGIYLLLSFQPHVGAWGKLRLESPTKGQGSLPAQG